MHFPVRRLQHRDVIQDDDAQTHHVDGVRAERFLMVAAVCGENEKGREKDNGDDARGGPGEELNVKMFLAEEPRETAAEERCRALQWGRVEGSLVRSLH